MGKKRKSEESRLDDVNRTLYSTFCNAANSLSQIYAHAMSQQKHAFQSGERHALEKLYQWIIRQHAEGARMTAADIFSYLQNEIDNGDDGTSASPMPYFPDQHPQPTSSFSISNIQTPGSLASSVQGLAPRTTVHDDQSKNAVFSNALSSPVRRSLQPFQLAQGEDYNAVSILPSGSGARNNNSVREANSHDSFMDMHSDSPAHDSY